MFGFIFIIQVIGVICVVETEVMGVKEWPSDWI